MDKQKIYQCRHWKDGHCEKRGDCTYVHAWVEPGKKGICQKHLQGMCYLSANGCHYQHLKKPLTLEAYEKAAEGTRNFENLICALKKKYPLTSFDTEPDVEDVDGNSDKKILTCQHWTRGYCQWGQNCHYLHAYVDPNKRGVCQKFLKKKCLYTAHSCYYQHLRIPLTKYEELSDEAKNFNELSALVDQYLHGSMEDSRSEVSEKKAKVAAIVPPTEDRIQMLPPVHDLISVDKKIGSRSVARPGRFFGAGTFYNSPYTSLFSPHLNFAKNRFSDDQHPPNIFSAKSEGHREGWSEKSSRESSRSRPLVGNSPKIAKTGIFNVTQTVLPINLENFDCPITGDIMTDPVVTEFGFTYERKAIENWFKNHDTDPRNRQKLSSKRLVPNINLRNQIEEYKRQSGTAVLERAQPDHVQSEKVQPEKAQSEKAQSEKAQSEKALSPTSSQDIMLLHDTSVRSLTPDRPKPINTAASETSDSRSNIDTIAGPSERKEDPKPGKPRSTVLEPKVSILEWGPLDVHKFIKSLGKASSWAEYAETFLEDELDGSSLECYKDLGALMEDYPNIKKPHARKITMSISAALK
ncbi:hypothetical protein AAMO2058_001358100 [Amorphochlora amoebiformis]